MGWFGPDVKKLQAAGDIGGLIKALGDKDEDVREAASEALAQIGKPAVEPLIKVLGNEFGDVSLTAVKVLVEIGDERAVEPLIKLLDKSILSGFGILVGFPFSNAVAEALGKIGDARAAEPLIKIFMKLNSDVSSFFGGKEAHYKAIANSLKGIPGAEAEFERLEAYDKAEEWYTFHGRLEEAAAVRRKKAELGATKVDQTVIHGDYVDDRDTIVKDSVVSKSNIGASGKSKSEELRDAKALLDDGIINNAEFQQMKKEILGK